MMTRLPLRLDDDLRRRLNKAAAAKGLPVAEVIRQACDAYLTGLDSYWARQVDQAVNATASTLQPLAEKLDAIQQNVSETLARVEHTAQQHQGDLDRANDDQQLLIAMVNELALFVFGASTTPETPVTAAIARERHAKWADDIRDHMVATRHDPASAIQLVREPVDVPAVTPNDRENINRVIARGRLDQPVALRMLDSGERVANYRVVTDGADIHQVAAYGADAVFAASKFSVGDLVHVEGEMRTRKTQTADDKLKGRTRTIREFQVQKQMLIEKVRSSPSESSGRLN